MSVTIPKPLFTVAEYYQMAEAGILAPEDRVELIEGEIIAMSPIGSRHAGCVNRLTQLFSEKVSGLAIVSVQNPIRLSDSTEPEPDLALLRPRADFYAQAHPQPADVLLVVEVADHSLAYDRAIKVPLYARAGIPETWVIDLDTETVFVYQQPGAPGYGITSKIENAL